MLMPATTSQRTTLWKFKAIWWALVPSFVTGTINDIDILGQYCRTRDIRLLVDAVQTAGTIPIDVEQMQLDFLTFSGHKRRIHL